MRALPHSDGPDDSEAVGTSVGQRFWALIGAALVLAVSFSAMAVWWQIGPILKEFQSEIYKASAVRSANRLDAMLSESRNHLGYLANNAAVLQLVLGDTTEPGRVLDEVRNLKWPDRLTRISVRDVLQNTLVDLQQDSDFPSPISDAFVDVVALRFIENEEMRPYIHVVENRGTGAFVTIVPILRFGSFEGVVIGRGTYDPMIVQGAMAVPGERDVLPLEQAGRVADAVVQPVGDTGLAVQILPIPALLARQRRGLLLGVAGTTGAILIIPFVLFAIAGNIALLRPHEALQASRAALREKQQALLSAHREIEALALRDPLTDLPNRRGMAAALEERLAAGDRTAVLLRADLDHFKSINDTLGHAAGDRALLHFTSVLKRVCGAGAICARFGGDEFVILLDSDGTVEQGQEIAARIIDISRSPVEFDGKEVFLSSSFGLAEGEICDGSASDLMGAADAALYLAKEQGRGRVAVYTDDLQSTLSEKRLLASAFPHALKNDEIVPYFQPQFDAQTDALCGLEVLARWHHPVRGVLTPAVFQPVAKQLGLQAELDARMFERGVAAVRDLCALGHHIPKVSFKVTEERLRDPALLRSLSALDGLNVEVGFEVLEAVLVDDNRHLMTFSLDDLRESGILIELDDFGSGHASIVGLMHLAPDIMKIDQRLIRPIVTSQVARRMVRSIVEISKTLGIRITAEGVETADHAKVLREIGCDVLQGYHFAKPMSAADIDCFLTESRQYEPYMA